jgi:hypothetical protein
MHGDSNVETEAVSDAIDVDAERAGPGVVAAAAPLAAQQGGGQHPRKATGLA